MKNRGKGIYVAVLNQGDIRTELQFLLSHLSHNSQYNMFFSAPAKKPIQHNRNSIVKDFLKRKEYDYLLMIDSDIVPPKDLFRLADYDVDVITPVMFAFKEINDIPTVIPLVLEHYDNNENVQNYKVEGPLPRYRVREDLDGTEGLTEVDATGTGCIMIKREVLENEELNAPFTNYFDEDGLRYEGLDLSFCRRAKDAGYKVFVDTDMVCSHLTELDLKQIYQSVLGKDIKSLRLTDQSNN